MFPQLVGIQEVKRLKEKTLTAVPLVEIYSIETSSGLKRWTVIILLMNGRVTKGQKIPSLYAGNATISYIYSMIGITETCLLPIYSCGLD